MTYRSRWIQASAIAALSCAPLALGAPPLTEESARTLVQASFTAASRGDTQALEGLLSDDFDFCNTDSKDCRTKRQFIAEVQSGAFKFHHLDSTFEWVTLHRDTALLMGRTIVRTTDEGAKRSDSVAFGCVLALRDQRWQLVTWSSMLLAAAAE